MSGYSLDIKSGRVRSTEADFLYLPNQIHEGLHPVILCHGANSPNGFASPASYAQSALGSVLADRGFIAVGGWFGGNTFGNDIGMTCIENARTLAGTIPGCDNSKIHLVGTSMGNGLSFRYAGLHPDRVASIMGLIPYSDAEAVYSSNRLGLQTSIAAAWGITAPDDLPAQALMKETHAPIVEENNIPYLAYYSPADTAVLPTEVTALATAAGGTAIAVTDSTGHTESAVYAASKYGGGTMWSHYLDWMKKYNG